MSPGRPKYTKPDANQEEIVTDLRNKGYDVDIVCDLPGLYDLVVSGKFYLPRRPEETQDAVECSVRVEVKQPGQDLSESEEKYYMSQEIPGSYIKAETAEDVIRWFKP